MKIWVYLSVVYALPNTNMQHICHQTTIIDKMLNFNCKIVKLTSKRNLCALLSHMLVRQ